MDASEHTIRVGFGDQWRELTVHIGDGDIPPYAPDTRFQMLGRRENRVDGLAKVTGRARYTYDQNPPGLLHGKILRSPHPNANVTRVDLAPALAMPGVCAAISFPEVFRTQTVRFAWDGIAAVAAETEAQAEAALGAIQVEYEVLPFCVVKEDAMAEGAPKVGRGDQENIVRIRPEIPLRPDGTINADKEAQVAREMKEREEQVVVLLGGADSIAGGGFDTQVQTHASLETHGVVCQWEGEKLICHCSTQATFGVRQELMHPAGPVAAPAAEVRCEYVGGGFGSKFSPGREGVAGALLARAAGRPVKLMLDRREEHTSTGNRPDSHMEILMGIRKSGEILAYRTRSHGTAGTNPRGAGSHTDVIYTLGSVDKVEYGVRTNCGDARPQRAPGFPQGLFALESILDMAAELVGIDPLEFRKKNDRHPIRSAQYDIARARFGWDAAFQKKPGAGTGPRKRGVGCASTLWFAAGGGGASVLVRILKNGRVEVRNGAQDIGTGTRTILAMVVAEELGIPLASIATAIGNTNDPQGPGSGGSTTAPTLAPAARLAAYNAKSKLLAQGAARWGVAADTLDLRDGRVVAQDGAEWKPIATFEEACALLDDDQIEVLQARPVIDAKQPNYDGFADTNAGVQCAEVEVDVETGVVRVLRVLAIQDAGKILNPKLAESQVRGGVIQGVSYALFERRIMDRLEGRMLNADLDQYKVAGAVDCPAIDVLLPDVFMGKNNTHVMGIGEPPVVATAAAIANAVYNATGARPMSLPITPRRMLQALGVKEA